MTENKNTNDKYADKNRNNINNPLKNKSFKIYIKPQSISDCFIATMDPKYPFKICLYPSIQSNINKEKESKTEEPDDLDQLIFHNYLSLRRNLRLGL